MTVAVPEGLSWWAGVPGGAAWLDALPALVAGCARDWSLELGPPFEPASVSWVAPVAARDGTPAVLKVNFPEPESEREAGALAWWGGDGAVRLLAHDPERRALLVERCVPGTQLWAVEDDDEATRLAAGVLRRLWRPAPGRHPFRALAAEAARWGQQLPAAWSAQGRPCPRALVDEAVALCAELGASQEHLVVCHQDLHGGNVLAAGPGRWLAIDPKPVVGEPAFDVASLLRDRRPELLADPSPLRRVRRRLDVVCDELGLDRERARGWALVHAVAWGLSEHAVYPELLATAALFAEA